MRLILIRHGESEANVSGELDTVAPGRRLTHRGQTQARAAGSVLRDFQAQRVLASALPRAQQTAEELAAAWNLPVETLSGIEEIEAGALEGAHDPRALDTYLSVVRAWTHGSLDRQMPGAGDGSVFFWRYDKAIASLLASQVDKAVVVSHGSAIRVWVANQLDKRSTETFAKLRLLNTGYVELEHNGSSWSLKQWHTNPAGGSGAVVDASVDPTSSVGDDPG